MHFFRTVSEVGKGVAASCLTHLDLTKLVVDDDDIEKCDGLDVEQGPMEIDRDGVEISFEVP